MYELDRLMNLVKSYDRAAEKRDESSVRGSGVLYDCDGAGQELLKLRAGREHGGSSFGDRRRGRGSRDGRDRRCRSGASRVLKLDLSLRRGCGAH